MAHIGEEFGFGAVREIGLVAARHQLLLAPAQRRLGLELEAELAQQQAGSGGEDQRDREREAATSIRRRSR